MIRLSKEQKPNTYNKLKVRVHKGRLIIDFNEGGSFSRWCPFVLQWNIPRLKFYFAIGIPLTKYWWRVWREYS